MIYSNPVNNFNQVFDKMLVKPVSERIKSLACGFFYNNNNLKNEPLEIDCENPKVEYRIVVPQSSNDIPQRIDPIDDSGISQVNTELSNTENNTHDFKLHRACLFFLIVILYHVLNNVLSD